MSISLGLLGRNISHSKSQYIYEDLLKEKIKYFHFDCESTEDVPGLEEVFEKVEGLSITTPYKEFYLDSLKLDENARKVGATNCIKKVDDAYFATNTDYSAVKEIVSEFLMELPRKVIIYGDGVMSRLTQLVLSELNFSYEVVSRKLSKDFPMYEYIEELLSSKKEVLLINCCSRNFEYKGPDSSSLLFWDHNYSFDPHASYFKNARYIDGLSLLRKQAEHALLFWSINR